MKENNQSEIMDNKNINLFKRLKNIFRRNGKSGKFTDNCYTNKPILKFPYEILESEKKDASQLMTEENFWKMIDDSKTSIQLRDALSLLSEDNLFGFTYWWNHFSAISYRQDLWAAVYIYRGGCGDDSFDYFRNWLITQGRDIFYNAIENADSLCNVFSELQDESPTNEEVNYYVTDIINKRHNDDEYFFCAINKYKMPEEILPEIEFEWEEDDEESLRNVCPNTFDRWWGKLRI